MRCLFVTIFLVAVIPTPNATAQEYSGGDVGNCLPPEDPYPYKLTKSDPLYDTARDEHQRHLEDMERYVNCLGRERGTALDQLKTSFELFLKNFGEDAVLKYGAERKVRQ